MKTESLLLMLLLGVAGNASNNNPQNRGIGTFQLTKHVISSGGSVMTTNNYQVTATLGQSAVGMVSSNSQYQIYGGFWTTSQGANDLIFKDGFE